MSAPQSLEEGGEGGIDAEKLNTLDEPVMETIKRDLNAIAEKL
jgi:hypothetical protein